MMSTVGASKGQMTRKTCVGVVIVHYFRYDDLVDLLEQLSADEMVEQANIVVCDNGSNPGEVEFIEAEYPAVIVNRLKNIGYGAAANLGVSALSLRCNHVFVATHELKLEPGCLRILSAALDRDARLGMAGPLLKRADDTNVTWSAGGRISKIRKMPYHRLGLMSGSSDCDWLDGSAIMFRRKAFEEANGFADCFFLYFEDVELGLVANAMGWRVRCIADAGAYQTPGGHLDHRLAVRNLAWTLRSRRYVIAYILWILENTGRIVIGTIGKPRGALARQRMRFGAILEALRLPNELKSRRSSTTVKGVQL
ncbi:glycosyltransferase [Rhodococcus fascians]|nr:glycosyltransferase [Rhodococcus fascians]MBY3999178.1 glycosyltransferase [Rhodococcus fascians]MBY4000254.1 glycosyltransferase [Rhodococcus fascians]MBY4005282.1 glycosyltransferase [Rhodococcus fascians]MBY4016932.1 glycosyltransferase [Rhodococcus fascians]